MSAALRSFSSTWPRLAAFAGRRARLLLLVEQRRRRRARRAARPGWRRRGRSSELLFCGTAPDSRPNSATSSGISAMFATLVQNTRLSASWRRFLRTSFSARRASATVLRKRSSSACCSGFRICCAPARPGPPLTLLQLLQLGGGLLQLVLQRLDLAEVLLLRLGLELAHHGQRPERRGAAAQRDQVVAGGELLDHAHGERQVAVGGHHHAAAEDVLHVDRGAVGEQVDVGDQDHRVLGGRFAQRRRARHRLLVDAAGRPGTRS